MKSPVITKSTSIEALRKEVEEGAEKFAKPIEGIVYIESEYRGVYAEWVVPQNAPNDKVVLYFHGGGFIMGSARSHRNIVGGFVNKLGIKALVFDYSLAPEHPAPAAVIDSVRIYEWLLNEGYKPENIVFAGDSAGGGVELGTLLKIKADGLPMPCACAAFSPCTDMLLTGESHQTRAKADPCTPKGANETYLSYYVGGGDPKHPYASPLYGDLAGLPPIIIQVGNDETLRDDSTRFADKAKAAGVDITCKVWEGMFHCFPLLSPMFPEATEALDEVCSFIKKRIND